MRIVSHKFQLADLTPSQFRYAPAAEIEAFYKGLAKEYDVYEHTKFRHAIRRAEWDKDENVWAITVENLETGEVFVDRAEVFLNLGGNLK